MALVDGVTPLNRSNLIGKQSDDEMFGSLAMIGTDIYKTFGPIDVVGRIGIRNDFFPTSFWRVYQMRDWKTVLGTPAGGPSEFAMFSAPRPPIGSSWNSGVSVIVDGGPNITDQNERRIFLGNGIDVFITRNTTTSDWATYYFQITGW